MAAVCGCSAIAILSGTLLANSFSFGLPAWGMGVVSMDIRIGFALSVVPTQKRDSLALFARQGNDLLFSGKRDMVAI
jgi:hypothetical protein